MKKRVLSALVMILIVVPIVIAGGKVFSIAVGLLAVLALKELIDLKKSHHKLPSGLVLYSAILLGIFVFYEYEGYPSSFGISQRLLIVMLLGYLFPTLFYHKENTYQTRDAFYLFGCVIFLGLAFHSLILIREKDLYLLGYLILIPVLTDTFAFLVGTYFGKRKLAPKISPGKTVEGSLAGCLGGTLLAGLYYSSFVQNSVDIGLLFCLTFLLTLVAQFGDLLFSKIKRENEIKDFSNLIPGHGGILDRLDSFLFVLMVYVVFLKFI